LRHIPLSSSFTFEGAFYNIHEAKNLNAIDYNVNDQLSFFFSACTAEELRREKEAKQITLSRKLSFRPSVEELKKRKVGSIIVERVKPLDGLFPSVYKLLDPLCLGQNEQA
jgi:hypothetical protein